MLTNEKRNGSALKFAPLSVQVSVSPFASLPLPGILFMIFFRASLSLSRSLSFAFARSTGFPSNCSKLVGLCLLGWRAQHYDNERQRTTTTTRTVGESLDYAQHRRNVWASGVSLSGYPRGVSIINFIIIYCMPPNEMPSCMLPIPTCILYLSFIILVYFLLDACNGVQECQKIISNRNYLVTRNELDIQVVRIVSVPEVLERQSIL